MLLALTGIGIHRARRYRLSRTRWRGIRGGQSGRSWRFAWLYLWTMVLIPITLGWIVPWRTVRLQKALFDDTRFGDKAFTFSGSAGPLYRRYWLVWLSAIVLLIGTIVAVFAIIGFDTRTGVPRPATLHRQIPAMSRRRRLPGTSPLRHHPRLVHDPRAQLFRHRRRNSKAPPSRLRRRSRSFVWLTASNYLIRVLSLGFLSPIAEARSTRYIVDRLAIDGPVPGARSGRTPTPCSRAAKAWRRRSMSTHSDVTPFVGSLGEGRSAETRPVEASFADAGLELRTPEGSAIALWPYALLRSAVPLHAKLPTCC